MLDAPQHEQQAVDMVEIRDFLSRLDRVSEEVAKLPPWAQSLNFWQTERQADQ